MKLSVSGIKKIGRKGLLMVSIAMLGMATEFYWRPIEKYFAPSDLSSDVGTSLDHTRIDHVWQLLEKDYLDSAALDKEKGTFGAIRGMVNALGDPYSNFFDPDEAKLFLSDTEGSFEGIGAEIGIRKGNITVIAPIHGTPAQRAGLKSGDIILQIDDIPTFNLTLDQAVTKIRGPKNAPVKLLLSRNEEEPFTLEITREEITIPALNLEITDGIAYLQLFNFSQRSDQEFEKAVKKILAAKAKGLILDLRNNPGGYLDRSIDIAGWFLPRDTAVVIEENKDKKRTILRSEGTARLKDTPLVILINEGSASASEILAGALSENLKTPLIGEKSFGKGLVQNFETLADGSAVKITVARWLTPSGISISNDGIAPTVEVIPSTEDEAADKDIQLEKAKEILLQNIK